MSASAEQEGLRTAPFRNPPLVALDLKAPPASPPAAEAEAEAPPSPAGGARATPFVNALSGGDAISTQPADASTVHRQMERLATAANDLGDGAARELGAISRHPARHGRRRSLTAC